MYRIGVLLLLSVLVLLCFIATRAQNTTDSVTNSTQEDEQEEDLSSALLDDTEYEPELELEPELEENEVLEEEVDPNYIAFLLRLVGNQETVDYLLDSGLEIGYPGIVATPTNEEELELEDIELVKEIEDLYRQRIIGFLDIQKAIRSLYFDTRVQLVDLATESADYRYTKEIGEVLLDIAEQRRELRRSILETAQQRELEGLRADRIIREIDVFLGRERYQDFLEEEYEEDREGGT